MSKQANAPTMYHELWCLAKSFFYSFENHRAPSSNHPCWFIQEQFIMFQQTTHVNKNSVKS